MPELRSELPRNFWVRVFTPFAAGYFLSYVFRSVNATVADELIRDLSLDAWSVGLLTSTYFLAFALAQLPIGIALDRHGPRRTEAVLLLAATLGGVVFATGSSPLVLVLGRGLIGFGVAACLMASFKSFVDWAPPAQIPALNGWVMACGSSGAILSTTPVVWGLQFIGWRGVFVALAATSVVVTLGIWTLVPEPETRRTSESLAESVHGLRQVFRSPLFWSLTPLAVMHQAAYLAIQSLWAGPWLRDAAGLDQPEIAGQLFWLAVSMVLGYISFGWLSQRVASRGGSILRLLVAADLCFVVILVLLSVPLARFGLTLWIAFGFIGSAGMLSYVILSRRFGPELSGRVSTALNLLTFLMAFVIQAGIGAVIQWYSPDAEIGDHFAIEGYRAALSTTAAALVAALVWLGVTSRWRRSPALQHKDYD